MTESEFLALADSALARLEAALEAADLDFEPGVGGVLEIEFAHGNPMVVNRHTAAREIWVAARSGGFHYRWDGAAWRDTRGGEELFAALSRLCSEQAGAVVTLA
ncbi:MAG: iron donor protein CyaY [Betaproteobacteria bacterium]|nr:iron donor protein CyaY [Betaproteobacteria bacterium]